MKGLLKSLVTATNVTFVIGTHALTAAFAPPVRMVVTTIGILCPIDDDLPSYVDEG